MLAFMHPAPTPAHAPLVPDYAAYSTQLANAVRKAVEELDLVRTALQWAASGNNIVSFSPEILSGMADTVSHHISKLQAADTFPS